MVGSEVLTPEGIKVYRHPAETKTQPETVVFVHHMWGNHRTTRRHFQFLNEQGYDCVSFDLMFGSDKETLQWNRQALYFYRGVFYVWVRQIRSILNFIEGDKIIFSFSGPSLSAFWASSERTDIKALICDGGPFHNLYGNTRNFFTFVIGVEKELPNRLLTLFGTTIWGRQPLKTLHKVLDKWPSSIPILSIRGVEDNIVSLESIRQVFTPHPQLDLTAFELPEGKHLDGMKCFPDLYKTELSAFLRK